MQNTRNDDLSRLPKWAQKRINADDSDIHDYFGCHVNFIFEDGSNAFFKDAFYFFNDDQTEVAILTEHCGYHAFAYYEGDEVIDKHGRKWLVDGSRVSGNMLPKD